MRSLSTLTELRRGDGCYATNAGSNGRTLAGQPTIETIGALAIASAPAYIADTCVRRPVWAFGASCLHLIADVDGRVIPMTLTSPSSKTATLFGGAGFIGRYIVRDLAQRGWRVRVVGRDPNRALFLKTAGVVGQVVPMFGNIRDDDSVARAVAGADLVINLVGLLYESGKNTFDAVHAQGAARIARAAAENGAERLMQLSAIGASSTSDSDYARTKAQAEEAILAAYADATILRPSIVFGPEDGFFNLFAGLAANAPALPLIGGGMTRFQPVYVGDVADAVMACLDDPATKGQVFELGGPQVLTFKELMQLTMTHARRKRFLIPIPWPIAKVQAAVLGLLPKPLLTTDQLKQLRVDNVVADGARGLLDLSIEPTAVEVVLPNYLKQYWPGGRFGSQTAKP